MRFLDKRILPTVLLLTALFIAPIAFLAQINPPNGCTFPGGCCPTGLPPSFCPGCPPCVPVPLNGELIFLLFAGLGIGYYYLKKQKIITI